MGPIPSAHNTDSAEETALSNCADSREVDALLPQGSVNAEGFATNDTEEEVLSKSWFAGVYGMRVLALMCACSLSIGSH